MYLLNFDHVQKEDFTEHEGGGKGGDGGRKRRGRVGGGWGRKGRGRGQGSREEEWEAKTSFGNKEKAGLPKR